MPADLDPVEVTYAEGSYWTPSDTNAIAVYTRNFQDVWEKRHYASDGRHRDIIVPNAWALITYAASAYTVAADYGVASCTWVAAGKAKVSLDAGIMYDGDSWMAFCWPNLVITEAVFMYESGEAGTTKDSQTVYVYTVDHANVFKNYNFGFCGYGVHA